MYIVILYILFPLLVSISTLFNNKKLVYAFSLISSLLLTTLSLYLFVIDAFVEFSINHTINYIITSLDAILLLYFAYIGFKFKSIKVLVLALVQLLLFSYCEMFLPSQMLSDFYLDKLSFFMLLVINLVGSIIAVYAVKYIEYEECSQKRKTFFLSYLWIFIFIMNMVVISNSFMLFFFFFELTTLSSYLLIKFREDEISVNNALRALWINQIGGVFILLAVIVAIFTDSSIYFSNIDNSAVLLPIFLAFAAFVKGASKPFESWLLGAMVAPTPVSAILHSATMVKIAPFLILKISYAFPPLISFLISCFAMLVFMVVSVQSLGKDNFKEILAYSTIALLALMVSIASIGTKEAFTITLYLIFFHAVSKALLFMIAGILEKEFHIKSIEDFTLLFEKAPKLTILILLAFASITLPPFGLFFAKLLSIEYLSLLIKQNPFYILVVIPLVVGSSVLVLLYFKVASKLIDRSSSEQEILEHKISKEFTFSSYLLFFIAVVSLLVIVYSKLSLIMFTIIIFLLFLAFFIFLKKAGFKSIDRVKEYSCGEKYTHNVGVFYYDFDNYKTLLQNSFIVMLFAIVILGLFL